MLLLFRMVDDLTCSLWRLGKLSVGYASHFICLDSSGNRILDIGDASLDECIDVHAILKGAVAFLIEGAVFECDMVHIAERLFTADVATHQLDVLAVPGEIFAIQFRIINRHVLALPETVLGRNLGMVNLHIPAVLEYILGIALQSIYIDVLGNMNG